MSKRDAMTEAVKDLHTLADAESNETARAVYTCTSVMVTALLLVSEELCETIKKARPGLLDRVF